MDSLKSLREARVKLGLTQAQLAVLLGVKRLTVQRMEAGDYLDTPKRKQGRLRSWTTEDVLDRCKELINATERTP
jgi:DNA-binding XRE family transcriptional regulator